MDHSPSRLWRRRALLLTVALLLLVGFLLFAGGYLDAAAVAEQIRAAGRLWWSPFAFIGAYILLALFLVPLFPLSIAATLMWGWLAGGAIELVAALLGSLAPYYLARSGSSLLASPGSGSRLESIQRRLAGEGFITLLVLRLVQIIPYSVLNYLAGAARLRFRDYLLATSVGLIPPIFVFTYLIDAVSAGALSLEQAWIRVALAGAFAGAFALFGRWLIRRRGL